ncbi:MAG TPA: tRNA (guanosine(46)-N7)-methyltransferase TrmB [Thiothrix sp.]|nr:tRNA (guanosine(46)-N7)-methyltransferase TrmB [Thiothrix sp.]
MDTQLPYMRQIRSFILRTGRLTKGQEKALTEQWPRYGIEDGDGILDFPTIFGRHAPVTLEIGFGNGTSLAEMARNMPDRDFLGIEVHTPGVGHLLYLIDEWQLSNVRVMNSDAVKIIQHRIAEKSLAKVQLFFPDPWHKKRHKKRRLVQTEFASLLATKLNDEGKIHLATDWQDYAKHIVKVMDHHPDFYNLSDTNSPYMTRPAYRPKTKFEQRGVKLGHGVWDLLYQKRQKQPLK